MEPYNNNNDEQDYKEKMDTLFQDLGIGPMIGDELVVLQGYLVDGLVNGETNEVLTYRIYLDLTGTEYIEVKTGDVQKWLPVATKLYPVSGMLIWIVASAKVRYVTSASIREVSDFLSGEVVDQDIPETTGVPNVLARRLRKRRRAANNGSYGGCNSNAAGPVCPN